MTHTEYYKKLQELIDAKASIKEFIALYKAKFNEPPQPAVIQSYLRATKASNVAENENEEDDDDSYDESYSDDED